MLRHGLLISSALLVTACLGDETVSGYAPGLWILDQVNGAPAASGITLEISQRGEISGHAHCNGYVAPQSAPYPWLNIGDMAVTGLDCPEIEAEQAYLAALTGMTLVEVSGPILILSNDAGETLEYIAYQP